LAVTHSDCPARPSVRAGGGGGAGGRRLDSTDSRRPVARSINRQVRSRFFAADVPVPALTVVEEPHVSMVGRDSEIVW